MELQIGLMDKASGLKFADELYRRFVPDSLAGINVFMCIFRTRVYEYIIMWRGDHGKNKLSNTGVQCGKIS